MHVNFVPQKSEVKTFRDKIGAHFAWFTGNKYDNDAERALSIAHLLSFNDDSF